MPLPKPPKTISKRRKHPHQSLLPFCHPASPAASRQPPFHHTKLCPPHTPLHKWRLRVVCTDPDATDDSSADEMDTLIAPNKRLIHEILLPLPHHPITPLSTRPRRRQLRLNQNAFGPYSRKPCCNTCETEDILLGAAAHVCTDEDAHRIVQCDQVMTSLDVKSIITEEEFTQFLSELVPGEREGHGWSGVIDGGGGSGGRQEDEITDIPDFDLDLEALAWINSLERLP